MIPIEAITAIAGTVLPPLFKTVKSIFGKKENRSPQDALDDIALAKPEILPQYSEAMAKLTVAQTEWFNRDITGTVPEWVSALRASIRPSVVVLSFVLLFIDGVLFYLKSTHALDESTRAACTGYIGTWMGDRIL